MKLKDFGAIGYLQKGGAHRRKKHPLEPAYLGPLDM